MFFLERGKKVIRGDVFILPKNANLKNAQRVKNDEFYTQFKDIETEITAYYEYNHDVFRNKIILMPCDDPERSNFVKFFVTNFKRYGLRAIIATSYAKSGTKLTDIEKNSPYYDAKKHKTCGKLFVMTGDMNNDDRVDSDDVSFQKYLNGDGDFRSTEVTKLRDKADIVVTNPPFSLFREFLKWIMDGNKKFIILGNKNAITYKDVFPLIKSNQLWLGTTSPKEFDTPDGKSTKKVNGLTRWFTNLDHGIRHEKMLLDTMANNLRFNKSLKKKLAKYGSSNHYPKYANYNAIEVPIVQCIPSDYKGIMGVPISFLDKFNPNQFEIVGKTSDLDLSKAYNFFRMPSLAEIKQYKNDNANWRAQNAYFVVKGKPVSCYIRIFVRNKN